MSLELDLVTVARFKVLHSLPDVAVKTIRTLLLVLLALLLPIRGAVAAAMLCSPSGAGTDHHTMMATTDHDEHDGHQHADHSAGAQDASNSGTAGHHTGGFEKCNLCCDFCSITPLLSALPSVPTPQDLSSVSFPALFAPAPSFLSDGQERPPRSI